MKLLVLGTLLGQVEDLRGINGPNGTIVEKLELPVDGQEELTVMHLATRVFDRIDELGWKEFVLCGFGVGGMVILQLALLLRGRDDMTLQVSITEVDIRD